MAGASISVAIDAAGVVRGLAGVRSLVGDHALLGAIGTGLVRGVQDRIEREQTPEGARFAPLLPAYALIKRGPGILRAAGMSGGLQGSMTFRVGAASVTVGSNKVYAAIHQFGGVIRPVRAQALAFFLGRASAPGPRGGKRKPGQVLVLAKKVTIPARPYLGFSAEDRRTVLEATEVLFRRRLGG